MKKIILTFALALLAFSGFSQSVFDKFDNRKDVTSLVVTKQMFKLMSSVDLSSSDPEAQEYLKLVNNLENIKVFTTSNASIASEMRTEVDKYLKGNTKLSELMRVNDDGKSIRFYSKEGKNENYISELLMFLDGASGGKSETVILSITGNIDLKQISKLTSDLKVPGSENLKELEKNK